MKGFFASVGLVSIAFLVLFIIKKIDDYFSFRRAYEFGGDCMHVADEKVFKAARIYAQGDSWEEVKELLLDCIDFDEEDVEEILSLAEKHKSDDDRGYSSFLKAVNKILGEEVYCIICS